MSLFDILFCCQFICVLHSSFVCCLQEYKSLSEIDQRIEVLQAKLREKMQHLSPWVVIILCVLWCVCVCMSLIGCVRAQAWFVCATWISHCASVGTCLCIICIRVCVLCTCICMHFSWCVCCARVCACISLGVCMCVCSLWVDLVWTSYSCIYAKDGKLKQHIY